MAAQLKQIRGSIGYVEWAYARQIHLSAALVQNVAGNFVEQSPQSITAAAVGIMAKLGANSDYRVSIVSRPRSAGVSDRVVHLDHGVHQPGGRGEGEEARRLPPLDVR